QIDCFIILLLCTVIFCFIINIENQIIVNPINK
uniref:NADH dehydrogenase subunit 1 n=1 Tax=Schistosoma curassoni TaxID=6186 RepID=A0A183KC46_9TREM